jgi:hypothetical protein
MHGVGLQQENMLAKGKNASAEKQEKILLEVMRSCTDGFADPGPLYQKMNGVDWNSMLQGDYFAGLVGLSTLSYDDETTAEFPLKHCNRKFDYRVDLVEELPMQTLPEDSIQKILNGEPFEVEIAGKVVQFKVPKVRDIFQVMKLEAQFPNRQMTVALRSRIVAVEGVEPRDIMDWLDGGDPDGRRRSKYKQLDGAELEKLRDAFDRVNCGIDNEIDATCPFCEEEFEVEVPLDSGLLIPGKSIRKRRRDRRRGMDTSDTTQKRMSDESDSDSPGTESGEEASVSTGETPST